MMKRIQEKVIALPLAVILIAMYVQPVYAQQVSVPVTFHKQEHSLSCEAAALKMALNAQGVAVEERELISKLPFDPTPKQNGIWGDPNEGFVGRINGRMMVTGYGVHWDPIAKVGNAYTATEVLRGSTPAQIAEEIAQGNPVIVWVYYGNGTRYSWRTPKGKEVSAVDGEHTIVAYGFDGPVTNPTTLYFMDPLSGTVRWSTAQFVSRWGALGNMGVVVKAEKKFVRLPSDTEIWELREDTKTRHAIETWKAFVAQGGTMTAVQNITKSALLSYKLSSSIYE